MQRGAFTDIATETEKYGQISRDERLREGHKHRDLQNTMTDTHTVPGTYTQTHPGTDAERDTVTYVYPSFKN